MRLINEIRFVHEEAELVGEVIAAGEKDFNEYYLQFAAHHNLDIEALNQKHQERIDAAYGPGPQVRDSDPHEVTGSISLYKASPTPERQVPSPYEMTKDELEIHECFNKLFKSIAMKIHPDKISRDVSPLQRAEYIRMFKRATNALEKHKYFLLLDMADALKIPQPKNYKQQTRWMKKEIADMHRALQHQKKMYTYLFAECETDEERDGVIHRFMTQLFGPLSTNNT
jgi:hypothetical protein|tara:strand:- start:5252 stop:5932 length:681 start_codon:yes stop_codon:yes gene_type:complete